MMFDDREHKEDLGHRDQIPTSRKGFSLRPCEQNQNQSKSSIAIRIDMFILKMPNFLVKKTV